MHLYSLTLQKATGISSAICGNFSGSKEQEICVARGKILEVLRPDSNGRIQSLYSVEVFGEIRCLAQFRLTGSQKDLIVVGSDSGRIVILEYSREKNAFEKLHQETFGKSGCRRIVPGQYLAVDPKGRSVMIGACEKQKLVYVLNRDASARLTISSPLDAHKSHTIVYSMVGLDCGFDNPTFAAIELDYAEADEDPTGRAAQEAQKQLVFYELDLGLNHVVRKWAEPIDNGANLLVQVPGGADGPGGVLVCAMNFVIYKNQGHPDVRTVIPRRIDLPPERGVLIVSAATHRLKSLFFFLLQTEYGDVFRVTLEYEDGDQVQELKMKYFDTIPVCVSLCVLKTGFLFAASEFGDHGLYRFQGIGEDADVESSSATLTETDAGFAPVFFHPRKLRNLLLIDEAESLMPVLDLKFWNPFEEETPRIFALCGRGARSSLRILRTGLAVNEMAVQPLPSLPNAVWTVKKNAGDEFDAYIVVSFANATLVLSIGENVEEVSDSGFLDTSPSLAVALLGEDSLVQVHPDGIRHIRSDGRINEWKTPGRRTIRTVGHNRTQVAISLGTELVYFEMDVTGQLMEIDKHEISSEISCLDIAPIPEGRQRSRFLAIGCADGTIRILSLDPDDCMTSLSVQAVSAPPESLLLTEHASGSDGIFESGSEGPPGGLFLNAGLRNGVLLRTEVDRVTGRLTDTRTRFLGLRSPKLFSVRVQDQPALLCLSTRPWLGYVYRGHFHLTSLSYETLGFASSFSSEQCAEGVVAVAGDALRIFAIEKLGESFNQTIFPLRYTPRKMVIHPKAGRVILVESDQGAFSQEEREEFKKAAIEATGAGEALREKKERREKEKAERAERIQVEGEEGEEEEEEEDEEEEDPLPDPQYGYPRTVPSRWSSCIRVFDARESRTTCLLELRENEAALNVCTVSFGDKVNGPYIAVSTVRGLQYWPKKEAEGGFLHVYRLVNEANELELVHKTPIEGIPTALASFQGRLLVGMGNVLRMYDLGKRKLLRKCENKGFPNGIVSIHVCADRIYVGDVQESFHYVKYRKEENQLYIFADDVSPRWLTCALHVDFDTMAGGDKFGNLYFVRLPSELSEEIEDDPTGGKIRWESSKLNGAPNKIEEVIQFHVGDILTSMNKSSLIPGGKEAVIYGTIMGCIGAFLPFTSREDVDFFSHLEMHMRQEHPPLCGRDHMAYRSSYFPVKNVIDGDLCEQFPSLPYDLQKRIAEELDRTPGEIMKKLEDIRNKII